MAVSLISEKVRVGNIQVAHGAIAGNGYGNVPFVLPAAQAGETLISLIPITNDPALQVSLFYSSGWRIAYYNAYSGQAGAGNFEVRWVYGK